MVKSDHSYAVEEPLPPYKEQEEALIPKPNPEDIEVTTENSMANDASRRRRRRLRLMASFIIFLLVSSAFFPLTMYMCSSNMGMTKGGHQASHSSIYKYLTGSMEENKKPERKKCHGSQRNNHYKRAVFDETDDAPAAPLGKRDLDKRAKSAEEIRKEQLEKAQKEMEKIKKEEADKLKDIKQTTLKALEREISVQDQENFVLDLGLWKPNEVVEPAGQKVMILTATDGNGANGEIHNVLEMAESNRREYCDYHNYIYKFINISRFNLGLVHPVWGKLNALKAAFDENPSVEWIWWMDLDIIIMNPEIDLARYVLNPQAMKKRLTYGRPLKHPSFAEYSNIRTGYNPDEPLPPNAAKPVFNDIESEDYEYADVNKIDMLICQDFFGLNAGSFFIRRSEFVSMLLDYWGDDVFIDKEFRFREQDTLGHLNINHKSVREHIGIVPQRLLNSYIADDIWSGYTAGDLAIHFAGCWIPGDCDARWMRHWKVRGRVPEQHRNTHAVGSE